jgi:hypothetical protein
VGIDPISYSLDIDVEIAAGPVFDLAEVDGMARDEDYVFDTLMDPPAVFSIPGLPPETDLDAYHSAGPAIYFSTDTTVELPGLVARPGDVVLYNPALPEGGTPPFEIAFSIVAAGLPPGVNVDGVSFFKDDMLLSFDIAVAIAPGVVAADEDVVRWDGASLSIFLSGAGTGLPPEVDVDAVHCCVLGQLLVSLDVSREPSVLLEGLPAGFADDEDVLRWDGAWSLWLDGSDLHPELAKVDLDAFWSAADPDVIFVDGFESGNVSRWSSAVGAP